VKTIGIILDLVPRPGITLSLAMALFGFSARAEWVAYNDHVPGSGTSPNATTNNIRLQTSGFLKEITTGTNLPVTLSITRSGLGITYTISGTGPAPGTPLYSAFNTFVSFTAATDSNVEITSSTVTYTFTGLNPSKRYSFKGGAVRGLVSGTNRWTKVEISGADAFIAAHTVHCLTSLQVPADLLSNQVAVNFGVNNTAFTGDMVDWENINPGADGSFSIVCSQYQGFVPNGGKSNGTNGYAITGIRLEEIYLGPPIIARQPTNQTVDVGATVTFNVSAIGTPPLSYQWYRGNSMIPDATNSSYILSPTTLGDSGAQFHVTIFNPINNVTSSNATLTVIQPPLIILPLTNVWRYNQDGISLGTSWRQSAYDDSAWPSGPGVLGAETDNPTLLPLTNTVLSITNAANSFVTTYYFRTHFTLSYDPTLITLTASNLIDDGAVFYLNGQEIYRQNMISKPNMVTYTTLANAAIEAAWTSVVLPSSALIQGDNVLAVEVHQASIGSSDIDWGMIIRADFPPPSPLAITSNPADRTVGESASATFAVGVSGGQPQFQWYKWVNDQPVAIPGATHQSYTISNTALSDAGYYFVSVSNVLGVVSSCAALLNVFVDTTAPYLVSADGALGPTNVLLSFSEAVAAEGATNLSNYYLTNVTAGGLIAVSSITFTNGSNIFLIFGAPRNATDNYLLVANNVRDLSPRTNTIAADSSVPVSMDITLFNFDQSGWDFYNPVLGPPNEPYEPPTNWNQIDFQVPEQDWGHDSAGLFAYNPLQIQYPFPVNTAISRGAIASYYRFPFQFAASPLQASLVLRSLLDDGLVAYFNGTELYRINMPFGAINAFSPANEPAALLDTGSIPLPVRPRFGSNVFAAELHAFNTSVNTLVFGAELKARILSWARGPVIITSGPKDLTVNEGDIAEFDFTGVGASGFQWKTNGVDVAGAVESEFRVRVPLAWDGMLVRVIASNETSSAISAEARLHITPDITPPLLVGAILRSDGLLVSFNEPVLAISATNLANYRITNSIGAGPTLTSATLSNATNVLLTIESFLPGDYKLIVNNVRDDSVANNIIAPNITVTIGHETFVLFSAVWRFFTNNVDLGTAWRALDYDDTASPWSGGAGLIADETTPPPEPILTPISRLDNGVYHYTFYFRYHLTNLFAAPYATLTFRHIIDDGAIFYFNGVEFHRFNMAAGSIDWLTQANTNALEGVYNGPFTVIVTNVLAGDNVIAVEVHQNGTASSDITFGAEFHLQVPTIVPPPGCPGCLVIYWENGKIVIDWPMKGFTLEQNGVLGANSLWEPLTNQSPYFVQPGITGQRFYRLCH